MSFYHYKTIRTYSVELDKCLYILLSKEYTYPYIEENKYRGKEKIICFKKNDNVYIYDSNFKDESFNYLNIGLAAFLSTKRPTTVKVLVSNKQIGETNIEVYHWNKGIVLE